MMQISNVDDVELSLPYIYKFNNSDLTFDEFKVAVRYKFFRLCCFYFIKDATGQKVLTGKDNYNSCKGWRKA